MANFPLEIIFIRNFVNLYQQTLKLLSFFWLQILGTTNLPQFLLVHLVSKTPTPSPSVLTYACSGKFSYIVYGNQIMGGKLVQLSREFQGENFFLPTEDFKKFSEYFSRYFWDIFRIF
jgi:hypothetical protein